MKVFLNRQVLLAAVLIAIILLSASLIYILVTRPATPFSGTTPASAAMTIIPASTSTPLYQAPTPTTFSPILVSSPTPAPGQFAIGVYVQITGTNGEGLRLRAEPGLSTQQLTLGYDSEVFYISNGPREVDGHIWWYLAALYDPTRSGWAVQDYLTVIQSP